MRTLARVSGPDQDETAAAPGRLISRDPISGAVVGEYEEYDGAAVAAAVARSRAAAPWWEGLGFSGRAERLRAFAARIAHDINDLADLIHRETGKSVDDAFTELLPTVESIRWAATHAARVLRRRGVAPSVLMPNLAGSVRYPPYGVVGVIGPWNYPAYTPIGVITSALAAGNTVVFKPSEFTPAVGTWLVEAFAAIVPERPVLQLVTGGGRTGRALCRSGVDKLAFTGSSATGRAVMAACAETLTPVVLECGGKDALIVAADAELRAAADAALWGGLTNAGQSCVGVEQVLVAAAVHDDFVGELTRQARELQAATAHTDQPAAAYGAMTTAAQYDLVHEHVSDALARGARALVGGPQSFRRPFIDPIVLVDVPPSARVAREETFGPVLSVGRVADAAEAVRRVNGGGFALGATVFSREHGAEIAHALRVGMVSINAPLGFTVMPGLPFGGVRESGFGRVHGAEGLREFARSQAVARARFAAPVDVMTFRRSRSTLGRVVAAVRGIRGFAAEPARTGRHPDRRAPERRDPDGLP